MPAAGGKASSGSTGRRSRRSATQPYPIPFSGELFPSPERRFEETVVFVHHFGGSKRTLARHRKLVAELGFDSVAFDLLYGSSEKSKSLPISSNLRFGARHIWTDQIEAVLNSVPGRKIVYSFSMPSNSAIEALARRRAIDVSALVCDGGPFLQISKCTWNLLRHEYGVKNVGLRALLTGFGIGLYGRGLVRDLPRLYALFPQSFPVLSFRGGNDPLVPPEAIKEFFLGQNRLSIETALFEDAHHIDALKLHPAKYRERLERFLNRVASPL